jgi:hypothetical protein
MCSSERPGAVKGAPLLGAAKRTLDGEDHSGIIAMKGKAGEHSTKGWGTKMAPSLGASDKFSAEMGLASFP